MRFAWFNCKLCDDVNLHSSFAFIYIHRIIHANSYKRYFIYYTNFYLHVTRVCLSHDNWWHYQPNKSYIYYSILCKQPRFSFILLCAQLYPTFTENLRFVSRMMCMMYYFIFNIQWTIRMKWYITSNMREMERNLSCIFITTLIYTFIISSSREFARNRWKKNKRNLHACRKQIRDALLFNIM